MNAEQVREHLSKQEALKSAKFMAFLYYEEYNERIQRGVGVAKADSQTQDMISKGIAWYEQATKHDEITNLYVLSYNREKDCYEYILHGEVDNFFMELLILEHEISLVGIDGIQNREHEFQIIKKNICKLLKKFKNGEKLYMSATGNNAIQNLARGADIFHILEGIIEQRDEIMKRFMEYMRGDMRPVNFISSDGKLFEYRGE